MPKKVYLKLQWSRLSTNNFATHIYLYITKIHISARLTRSFFLAIIQYTKFLKIYVLLVIQILVTVVSYIHICIKIRKISNNDLFTKNIVWFLAESLYFSVIRIIIKIDHEIR